jgi:hypothetical protein
VSNDIFDSLFREKADVFRAAFSSVSTEVFYDPKSRQIRHAGEYGMYRESIVRDFLKFIVPRGLDISTGFVITSMNDVSTQCDIVIFDSKMTPLYQEGDRQRFFPVESIFGVGEVKSTLSKTEFKKALNKLAAVKSLGERIKTPTILRKSPPGPFDPVNHQYDLVPSILLCQKLDFDLANVENEIDSWYGPDVQHRHKHNMILSVEDGLLSYFDKNDFNLPYSRLRGVDLKHRFTYPGDNKYVHVKLFSSYMFLLTSSKTLFYPEFSDYVGTIVGGSKRDQGSSGANPTQ